jgi:uncharacterized protein YjbI with pentapeptide repeats
MKISNKPFHLKSTQNLLKDDTRERIKQLREVIVASNARAYTTFLPYLAILIYLFIAVTGTNHEDLLRETPKSIPFLNVQVDLWWFFCLGPWAFLLIHLNLIVQYYYLAQNLHRFKRLLSSNTNNEDARSQELASVSNFMLANLILDKSMPLYLNIIMRFVFFSFSVIAPLFLLILFQGYFLPYHDYFVTNTQRIALIADAISILLIWPSIILNHTFTHEVQISKQINNYLRAITRSRFCFTACVLAIYISFIHITLPDEGINFFRHKSIIAVDLLFQNLLQDKATDNNSTDKSLGTSCSITPSTAVNKEGFTRSCPSKASFHILSTLDELFPQNISLENHLLLKSNASEQLLARFSASLEDLELTRIKLAMSEKLGLNLKGRDLKYANLAYSKLPYANISHANLECANLTGGQLQGVKLDGSDLRNADLRNVNLIDTTITYADLSGADLEAAKLYGADLFKSDFSGAYMADVQIKGANLWAVIFIGSYLKGAYIESTNMYGAQLQHSKLKRTRFKGVDLYSSNFNGAMFERTEFEASYLNNSTFLGVNLNNASFLYNDLRCTHINEPDFNHDNQFTSAPKWCPTVPFIFNEKKYTSRQDQDITNIAYNNCLNPECGPCPKPFIESFIELRSNILLRTACEHPALADRIFSDASLSIVMYKDFAPYTREIAKNIVKYQCEKKEQLPPAFVRQLEDYIQDSYAKP